MCNLLDLPTPFNMIVLVVALVMSVQIVKAIAWQVRLGVCHYFELQFKREMVERGLAIDEIQRLAAMPVNRPAEAEQRASCWNPPSEPNHATQQTAAWQRG